VRIRPGRPTDAAAVAAVCRATARLGAPLPRDHPAPWLVSAVYAEPYLALEPGTARLLLDDEEVVGYAVAAVDSAAFYRRWVREWTPRLSEQVAGLDVAASAEVAELARLLVDPRRMLPPGMEDHPSHLHVNLLPAARGAGRGAALLSDVLAGLRDGGSPGVHLGVDPRNQRAAAFYRRLGFRPLGSRDGADLWGRRLTSRG
jgi:ribosomal protein S18 acetylase RimI-like enzyme